MPSFIAMTWPGLGEWIVLFVELLVMPAILFGIVYAAVRLAIRHSKAEDLEASLRQRRQERA